MPTQLTIHYNAPEGDPHKIPRPHRIDLTDGEVSGGEHGKGLNFVCIHPALDPQENGGPIFAEEIVHDLQTNGDPTAFSGFRAAFEHDPDDTFSTGYTINRMELS